MSAFYRGGGDQDRRDRIIGREVSADGEAIDPEQLDEGADDQAGVGIAQG